MTTGKYISDHGKHRYKLADEAENKSTEFLWTNN